VLAHVPVAFRLAARCADVVYTTPQSADTAESIVRTVRAHEEAEHRRDAPLLIFADLVVFLDEDGTSAERRKQRLDDLDGRPLRSDACIFYGTPAGLAELMVEWHAAGIDGFRLRPGTIPHDLETIAHELVGTLQDRSVFRGHYQDATLRTRLGLSRPANRYTPA
jgi:alkanesulfonate monooxygenase SsuD/methylene tetrahydromethanopterin reductase-like flavin-dependent oxidoreductase (luciferase family)